MNFANRKGIFDDFWNNVGGVPQNCPQLLVDAFNELLNAVESSRADAIANSRAQKIAKTQRQKARETQLKYDTDPDTNPDPDPNPDPDTDTFNGGNAAILNW